jgi:hypothetical protein
MTSNARDGLRAFMVLSHSSRTRSCETLRGRDGSLGVRIELHLQRRDEARRAEHPQAILGEALDGVPDRSQHPALEVLLAFEGVDDVAVVRIDRDGIHGEIAPRQVRGNVVDEGHGVGTPTVAVGPLPSERGHLVVAPVKHHGHRSVLDPGRDHLRKDALHLLGARVRGDVPVRDGLAEQQVSHTPAHNPPTLAALLQPRAQVAHVVGDGLEEGRRCASAGVRHGGVKA